MVITIWSVKKIFLKYETYPVHALTNPLNRFCAGKFTEDGSFIGQYGPGQAKKKEEPPSTSSAVATYV